MKKTILFFLIVLLAFPFPVSAESNIYDLDEMGLQVAIPSEFSVITRDTSASDPIFSNCRTTKSAVIDQFEASGIYLNAISPSFTEEIVFTMTESSLDNFAALSDTMLNITITSLKDQFSAYGFNVSKHEVYHHAQTKFVKMYFSDSANTVHGLQYSTVYCGKAMNFTMRSYSGSLSSEQEATIQQIVDCILFDSPFSASTPTEQTDGFVYTDPQREVTFCLSSSWKEEPLSKDRQFLDAKFISTQDTGCSILYGSTDIWSQMSVAERSGSSREEMNNSAFTRLDIAQAFDIPLSDVSIASYNGVEYFAIQANVSSNVYGLDLSLDMTQLLYFDDGWMYTFQFSGTDTHILYSDFEALLESVEYPAVSIIPEATATAPTIPETIATVAPPSVTEGGADSKLPEAVPAQTKSSDSSSPVLILIILGILAIAFVAVILHRAKAANAEFLDDVPPVSNATVCKNCGQPLPSDSAFCHKCGTKIY
ncbi:MAG: zinc ribbon domain-containing protein [Ruminococcaceae bacterium]|nr:zinc ribbon domain-containing protein [Oscillospiraceae bacterium]